VRSVRGREKVMMIGNILLNWPPRPMVNIFGACFHQPWIEKATIAEKLNVMNSNNRQQPEPSPPNSQSPGKSVFREWGCGFGFLGWGVHRGMRLRAAALVEQRALFWLNLYAQLYSATSHPIRKNLSIQLQSIFGASETSFESPLEPSWTIR